MRTRSVVPLQLVLAAIASQGIEGDASVDVHVNKSTPWVLSLPFDE
jgi:hypothetical protein